MATKDEKAEAKAEAEAIAEAEETPAPGTTVPGGQYKVGGKMVDSEGVEIGKKKEEPTK